ncbi:MAG: segregation/condensation protein A [Candidatus Omnitrophica bacterium]|nr:segregation/condensation protein A [Candidatus Omnitrophota bacterium]
MDVKLAVYEGPLDLLLDLIKKNEMDIYNIPMAEITRQYLDYLGQMQELNLDVASEFLVMAATLIYIKSKMLLPDDGLADETDEGGSDPREELVRKLLEYQAFREVARELGFLENERSKIFTRQISDYVFQDLEADSSELEGFSNNFYDLLQAFYKVLRSVARDSFHEVFEQVISIEEKMEQLKGKFAPEKEVSFLDLCSPGMSRNEIIVTFLAILELIRQKRIRFYQSENFGDIRLKQVN